MFSMRSEVLIYQWNPELFYPYIKIPTYISIAGKDQMINSNDNYTGALNLKEKYNKSNFTIKLFEDLDHNLSKGVSVKEIDIEIRKGKKRPFKLYSFTMDESAIIQIIEWITKL